MSSVQYLTPKKSVGELNRAARRSSSAQAVAEIMFVKMAQEQQLDERTISEYPDLFVQWDENWRGKAGDIVQDEGQLYRSIHDVKDAGQNTKPSATPSMWTRIGNPLEEFPEWIQPIGAHDAYDQGAKVTHNGKRWVSGADGNVWEPVEFTSRNRPGNPPRSPRTGPRSSRASNRPPTMKTAPEGGVCRFSGGL